MSETRTVPGAERAVFREGRRVALNEEAFEKSAVVGYVVEPEGDRGISTVIWIRGGGAAIAD